MTRFLLALFLLFTAAPALAQETEAADRSYFLGLIEDKLSTPDRIIRIADIQGALSSNATIGSITVADKQGVWLKVTNARIVWTRSALLLGRLSIDTLAADSIEVSRKPVSSDTAPAPESSGFQLPELPLSITLDKLDVPQVSFGQTVFGLQSMLAVTGNIALDDGALDSALAIRRLDGPGGALTLAASYANSTKNLKLDLKLDEPQNGVVANLLGIPDRPPVALALQGEGPLSKLDLNLTLDADGKRALQGTAEVRGEDGGYGFSTTLGGDVASLIAGPYKAFFGPETKLTAEGLFKAGGGVLLKSLALDGAALDVNAAAETSADGFLRRLGIYAYLGTRTDQVTVLPVSGGETTVRSAELRLSFGETQDAKWTGSLDAEALASGSFSAKKIALKMGGAAENLDDPSQRAVTFAVKGGASGIVATRADVAEALGKQLGLDIEGDWKTGQPINLAKAALTGNGLSAALSGRIAERMFTGNISVDAASIAPFSALAGRDLDGRLKLDADGSVAPIGGSFDLALDGSATGLQLGSAALDKLLAGETRITGRVARGEQGFRAQKLSLSNSQVTIDADGVFATGAADFNFDLALSDLALVSDKASGRLTATGRAKGQEGVIGVTLKADVPEGTLAGKALGAAKLGFDGTLKGSDVEGRVTGEAKLAGTPVTLAASVAARESERRVSDLALNAGGTAITGGVAQELPSGLLTGELKLVSPDVSTLAALALVEASGAANADVSLAKSEDGKQSATVSASVSNLVAQGVRVGRADLQARIADLFGVPVVNGSATGEKIVAGGVTVETLKADASATGSRTNFSADAALANAATASVSGALEPENGGFRLTLDRAELAQSGLRAQLAEPGLLHVQGSDIAVDSLALDVGGGRVRANGKLAETLDLSAEIEKLPLNIANAVKPDLQLGGIVDGTAKITGTRAQPDVQFDLTARDVAAAALRRAGLKTIEAQAKGRTSGGKLDLDAAVTSPEGLDAKAAGQVPLDGGELALDVSLGRFPLAILNAVVANQKLAGELSGTARVTGTLEKPGAGFDVRGSGINAAALSRAGLKDVAAQAKGEASAERIAIDATVTSPQGLRATAKGTVPLNDRPIALDVALDGFPLAALNEAVPGQNLSGSVTGTAKISGTLREPAADFDLKGSGLNAAPLKRAGLSDLSLSARGKTEGRRLNLDAKASSPQGLRLAAQGFVPLDNGPLGVDVKLDAFPLSALNAAVPGQGIAGSASGTARISGTLREPAVDFDLKANGVGAAPLSRAGLTKLSLNAKGRTEGRRLNVNATVASPQGLKLSANGFVPLDNGQLGVDVKLDAFPLKALNAALPGQALAGTVTGSARVSGTLADPAADFRLDGRGISAAPLASAGAAPLTVTLAGRYAGKALTLSTANATGPGGIRVSASGRAPLTGTGADLRVDGTLPLTLANRFLAERGAQARGTLGVNITLTGSLTQPVVRGTFSTSGAAVVDPQTNLRAQNLQISGSLDGERLSVNASASVGGGRITASGTVGITGDFPADIRVGLAHVRYADGNLVVATVSGDLALSGPVTRDPLLSGSVTVERAELSVPDRFGGAAALNVKHRKTPPRVAATLKRAKASDGTPVPTARPSVLLLNVKVDAPARIFVRGRGLDAELGGSVQLTGPVSNIQPVGGFKLIRGRLEILGQRITFDEGTITLVGDLDPFIDFIARSEGDDITVFVNVRGRVSDISVTFSSQPELPQDEVLARLIFNRGINELSAFQIAQLASAAAELAGGGNNSLIGNLRKATGLDDLDVVTDSQGNAALRAGRYIQDSVYLGLEAGAGGSTNATINLDVTKNLKAKGTVGVQDSSLGLFYEKDY